MKSSLRLNSCVATLFLFALPARADQLRSSLTKVASGKTLPAVARSAKKDLHRIAQYYRKNNTKAGDAAWSKLAKRLFNKKNKGQAAAVINYILYQAHIAPQPKLATATARLHFYQTLQSAISQQRSRLRTALRSASSGRKVTVQLVTFNTTYRPGVIPVKTGESSRRTDDEKLQKKRAAMLETMFDDAIDEAKESHDEAKEQFKKALRLMAEHMSRMTQVTQKITS